MLGLFLALALSAPAATGCPQHFAGGVQPSTVITVEVVCFTGFAVGYDAAHGDPDWSAEHLTAASVKEGEADARNGAFHPCPDLPPAERVTPGDYDDSGYDRGHMTPAGDRGADKPETFGMCNMVPQTPNLNRKVWAGIEASLRNLAAQDGELYVVTGPAFTSSPARLKSKVDVPYVTWKAVYDPSKGLAEAWWCTNLAEPDCKKEPVATLKAAIGFDPLPGAAYQEADFLPPPTKGETGP